MFFRTLNSVLAVVISCFISSIFFRGTGFIWLMPTLVTFAGIFLGLSAMFKNKTWIPYVAIVMGYFGVLLSRIQHVTAFTAIVSAGILGGCVYYVPKVVDKLSAKFGFKLGGGSNHTPARKKRLRQSGGQGTSPTRAYENRTQDLVGLPQRGIGVYGTPGAGLSQAVKLFGAAKVAAGVEGEEATSRLLSAHFRNATSPVALVNSIQFAGSKTADVDHALISGKKVFLIDSKKYRDGKYMATSSNTVTVNSTDGKTRTKRVNMDAALKNYRQILPRASFPKAYVIMHTKGEVIPREIGGVFFGSPNHVVSDIKSQIGSGAPNVDSGVFNAINSRRK